LFILGILLLRKYQRRREPKPLPTRNISGPFHFPNMHNPNSSDYVMRGSDKFDPYAKYEVYANPYHGTPQYPKRFTPVELSAYRMTKSPYELAS
jgi:hypothetical protein